MKTSFNSKLRFILQWGAISTIVEDNKLRYVWEVYPDLIDTIERTDIGYYKISKLCPNGPTDLVRTVYSDLMKYVIGSSK